MNRRIYIISKISNTMMSSITISQTCTVKDRFIELWHRLGGNNANQEYKLLEEQYSQKHRKYHNLNHIKEVLEEFDKVRHLAENPNAIELAILYHDIIYYPKRSDNEIRSAIFLQKVASRSKIEKHIIITACNIILATNYNINPKTVDQKIISDCDLASLGKSWKKFYKNSKNIKQEYSELKFEEYTTNRIKLMKEFLKNKQIYNTKDMRKLYESQARKNLNLSINILECELWSQRNYRPK
jgi:predicted metal-dependent HD superfamily phosphohydrolase